MRIVLHVFRHVHLFPQRFIILHCFSLCFMLAFPGFVMIFIIVCHVHQVSPFLSSYNLSCLFMLFLSFS